MRNREWFKYILECSARVLDPEPAAYLTGRGIALGTAVIHGLGWDPDSSRVTFPYLDQWGEVIGWKGRYIGPVDPDRSTPKYHAAPGGHLGAVRPLPADAVNGPTIICEGEFDALALISLGLRAVSVPGASSWSLVEPVILDVIERSGDDRVILAIDGDSAGDRLTGVIMESLADSGLHVTKQRPPEGRDVTDELSEGLESVWLRGLVSGLGGDLTPPF